VRAVVHEGVSPEDAYDFYMTEKSGKA